MKTKLLDTILISLAIGSFLLWILEIRRTNNFVDSYPFLMLSLTFLLAFQYVRVKRRQDNKEVSPTINQLKNTPLRAAPRSRPATESDSHPKAEVRKKNQGKGKK